MYHPEIIARRLHAAKNAGLVFSRKGRDYCIEVTGKLNELRKGPKGILPQGQLVRELDMKEQAFITSERILCKADFMYYLTRYHTIARDGGVGTEEGVGVAVPLESQETFIREVGKREKEVHEEYAQYKHTEGIRVYAHKCRQVVFSTTARALSMHRMLFWPGTRSFLGALEPDGCAEMYKRDKLTLDNLPFWLYPGEPYPDVKDSEIGFIHPLNSRLLYQAENQKTGIGVGTQQDISHLTEVPLWRYPGQINYSFIPSLPKSRMTLHIQEGTSAGKGTYWQDVTESCRKRLQGYESWTYIFVPWYLNRLKWRSNAPVNWSPEDATIKHAELIERTSPEWCNGSTFRPSADQLYWWETERKRHTRQDEGAYFYANYPATPEQSFVNWAKGALPVEVIESMEFDVRQPKSYSVEVSTWTSDPPVIGCSGPSVFQH